MRSGLAIAAVTAVLKNLLDNELIALSATANMGDVTVSVLPPDRIPTGAEERTQLNLWLYQLTPNSGWRHGRMLTVQAERSDKLPLALDLHYLLTAYGERDFQAEILLGHAIQLLHETPILTRETMQTALTAVSASRASGVALPMLSAATMADQLEQVKISPEFLSMEEVSKLWSGLQTRSRLSATYQVSMVLIEDRRANTAVEDHISKVTIS